MLRLALRFALIVALLPAAQATAEELDLDGYKRYPVESGIIEFKISGAQTGTETMYFDQFGLREAKYTNTEMMGTQRQALTLILSNWMYSVDLVSNTGNKMETPMLRQVIEMSETKDLYRSGVQIMDKIGGQKIGMEVVAGKECEVWEMKQMNTKTWFWQWIPVKTQVKMGTMEISIEATSIKEDVKIPDEKFAIPKDVKITEGSPQQMMPEGHPAQKPGE